jgi:broad specificity phosphatase PhoE
MLRLILIRHGETERNSQGKLQGGLSDLPLNERGREQARRLGLALSGEKLEAVYSSPLRRALATAEAICSYHPFEVRTMPALAELNMGTIDGLDRAQIIENHADFWRRWQEADYSVALPGGESVFELQRRAWGAAEDIRRRHLGGSVALVGHGIALQTIIATALDAPLSGFRRFSLAVASTSILHMADHRSSLAKLNDTGHLDIADSTHVS